MKAFLIDGYKPRDGGRIADIPDPVPTQGQVLVRVHAAGVNLLDAKIRSGEFKSILSYRMPLVLGHDVAGDVVAVGPDVRRFKVGDEVYARPDTSGIGTFAELIAMNESDVALKPTTVSMAEAASVPLIGLTAWQALVERANVQPGEKVFIQAGSGGVGTIAIQLAKHLGATVATTAGAASAAMVAGLGADIVIDYRHQDVEAVLEVRLLDGPLFVGEHYDVVHTIVGISESRRTESFWTQSAITPAGGGTTIATVLLHQGVFKDSFPDYPREAAADAPA